jgi:hypothetical protein
MALAVLGIASIVIVPVAIGWRVALHQMKENSAPPVKLFF